jgi:hypothetical protein
VPAQLGLERLVCTERQHLSDDIHVVRHTRRAGRRVCDPETDRRASNEDDPFEQTTELGSCRLQQLDAHRLASSVLM